MNKSFASVTIAALTVLFLFSCSSSNKIKKEKIGNDWVIETEPRRDYSKETSFIKEEELNIESYPDGTGKRKKKKSKAFSNAVVKFKFQLPDEYPKKLLFNDPAYTGAKGGHICRLILSPSEVILQDDKTGIMSNRYREMVKINEERAIRNEYLEGKSSKYPVDLALNQWHDCVLKISNDTMSVDINNQHIGLIVSNGINHQTKKNISFNVASSFEIIDYNVWRP